MSKYVLFVLACILLCLSVTAFHVKVASTSTTSRQSQSWVRQQRNELGRMDGLDWKLRNSEFERTEPVFKQSEKVDVNKEGAVAPAPVDDDDDGFAKISDDMRSRLKRELQSQGADPNYSAGPILGNPILIISGILAILVIAGGKGIFY